MANPNKSRLDAAQCMVNSYDSVEEAQRSVVTSITDPAVSTAAQNLIDGFDDALNAQKVSIVNSIEYAIELSAADGDSVITYADSIRVCNVSVNSSGGSPTISTEIDCSRYSSFSVYTNINGNPAATGYTLVQGTCSDTGSNWHDLTSEIYAGKRPPAASTSIDATDKKGSSGVFSLASRRIRLYIPVAGKPSTGTVEYSIVLRT